MNYGRLPDPYPYPCPRWPNALSLDPEVRSPLVGALGEVGFTWFTVRPERLPVPIHLGDGPGVVGPRLYGERLLVRVLADEQPPGFAITHDALGDELVPDAYDITTVPVESRGGAYPGKGSVAHPGAFATGPQSDSREYVSSSSINAPSGVRPDSNPATYVIGSTRGNGKQSGAAPTR